MVYRGGVGDLIRCGRRAGVHNATPPRQEEPYPGKDDGSWCTTGPKRQMIKSVSLWVIDSKKIYASNIFQNV